MTAGGLMMFAAAAVGLLEGREQLVLWQSGASSTLPAMLLLTAALAIPAGFGALMLGKGNYAGALTEFDHWLSAFLPKLGEEDVVMITADHGCDPSTKSTDHSREYTPCLMIGNQIEESKTMWIVLIGLMVSMLQFVVYYIT